MDIKQFIRNDLKDYIPYNAKETKCKVKLDANESPFHLSKQIKEDIIKWLNTDENLNRYPDTDCKELRKKLGEYWNVKPKNIICGVGSDQIIDYICKIFLEPEDIVCVPSPSFSMYTLTAQLNRAKVVNISFDNDFEYNADKIIEVCKANNPKILFICNPNNPTGKQIKVKEIKKILEQVNCIVVVDEAYAEFNDITMIPYINKYTNMIVLRTFSKAYNLAGIRVGYAVANNDIIKALEIVKTPFNLSTLSQFIATKAIENSISTTQRIDWLKVEKDWLYKKLKRFNILKVYSSHSNFIYVESKIDIAKILKDRGIIIRSFKAENDLYKSRITVGDREENKKLLKVLKKLEDN